MVTHTVASSAPTARAREYPKHNVYQTVGAAGTTRLRVSRGASMEVSNTTTTTMTVTRQCNHRQRGSGCTVLTATGLVDGDSQNLTRYKIETLELIDIKLSTAG